MKSMLTHRRRLPRIGGKLALIAAAGLSLPLLMPAPTASAGDVQWSVTVGSGGSGGHSGGHSGGGGHYQNRDYSRDRGHVTTRRVYHPPVYRTSYDSCGRAFRVCVRAGYYETVYVSASYESYSRPRYNDYARPSYRESYGRSHRDYNRRGQWGNRGSDCGY